MKLILKRPKKITAKTLLMNPVNIVLLPNTVHGSEVLLIFLRKINWGSFPQVSILTLQKSTVTGYMLLIQMSKTIIMSTAVGYI